MSKPVIVTDETFADDVLASEKTVLVDFWATWCGPCRMVAPVLEEIAAEHQEKITIAKLDVDENPATARDFQVMSIPTLIVFQDGKAGQADHRRSAEGDAAQRPGRLPWLTASAAPFDRPGSPVSSLLQLFGLGRAQ